MFGVKSSSAVGARAADVRDVRRVSGESFQPALRPVLLLTKQRVWVGGTSRARLSDWLLGHRGRTSHIPASLPPRGDWRVGFTYANKMEMTQTRGHADRFHQQLGEKSVQV